MKSFVAKRGIFFVKNSYPSKSIENKGIAFNNGSPVGIWYYFDETGKLTLTAVTEVQVTGLTEALSKKATVEGLTAV